LRKIPKNETNNFMNKLIVVTGGSKGIGRACVQKFAANGFDVFTCSRSAQDLIELKDSTEQSFPGCTVFTFAADLSRKDEAKDFAGAVKQLNRPVDILVNNAGYFIPGEIASEKEGTLESMIEGNLYSAYYTTREILPVLRGVKGAHIFNMCSIASIEAYPNGGSYAISKFALLGFSKCIREELKPEGIRVTAVLPGATLTASWEGTKLPNERFMKSEDIAETIFCAWSLSDRSVIEEILIRPQLGDI
jgi:short-subunit dehydrogenase